MAPPAAAIILAAGKGTRMQSELPKVAVQCAGAPMVDWVAQACIDAGCERVVVVVGYRQELVRAVFASEPERWGGRVTFAVQESQRGTGHAAQCAAEALAGFDGPVFVLAGDGPLLRPATLVGLRKRMADAGAAAAMATCELADPQGYGRIIRGDDGGFAAIVEEKDATDAQRAVREVNVSLYCFDAASMFAGLAEIQPSGVTGELYVTDVPGLLLQRGKGVAIEPGLDPAEAMSVNTVEQLAQVQAVMQDRLAALDG